MEQTVAARESAKELVAYFTEKFSTYYGTGHLVLAQHAAFPVSITTDLLYQLWANFKTYTDALGSRQTVPMLAVSDVLLSSLFRKTGRYVYEMLPETRALLLDQLRANPAFGEKRINDLAAFLYQYVRQLPDRPELKNFKEAQQWAALLAIDPAQASRQIMESLVGQIGNSQVNTSIGITNLIESFAGDNAAFLDQLAGRLASTDEESPAGEKPATALKKKLLLNDGPAGDGVSFNIPSYISQRLLRHERIGAAIALQSEKNMGDAPETAAGNVHALVIGIDKYREPSMGLAWTARDATAFATALAESAIAANERVHLMLNEQAGKEQVRDWLAAQLPNLAAEDTLIIYFAGHAKNEPEDSLLAMYDFSQDDPNRGSLKDHELREWISAFARNHPWIVLILDTHAGSRHWLDEKNSKHICLMASHFGETVDDGSSTGGAFMTAGILQALKSTQGNTSYRDLYAAVFEHLLFEKARQHMQTPLFVMAADCWDRRVFTQQPVNVTLRLQMLFKKLSLTVDANGRLDPNTRNLMKQFMDSHGISHEGRLEHYLKWQLLLNEKQPAPVLLISSGKDERMASIFHDSRVQLLEHIWISATFSNRKLPDAEAIAKQNSDLLAKIAAAAVVIIGYREPSLMPAEQIETVLDMAFAYDREVVLYAEDGYDRVFGSTPGYERIIWNNLVANRHDREPVYSNIESFWYFMKRFLPERRSKDRLVTPEIAAAIEEAKETHKLDLSSHGMHQIPDAVFELPELEELYLEGNAIELIPPSINRFTKLRVLNMNGNPVKYMPAELLQLRDLEILAFANSGLRGISEGVGLMQSLRELRVHGSMVRILPDALADLPQLEVLDARECPVLNTPRSVISSKAAPRRFREFVASFRPPVRKPVFLLLGAADTSLAELVHSISPRLSDVTVNESNVHDTPTLYQALRKGLADQAFVYLYDKDGRIFKNFDQPSVTDRLANLGEYVKKLKLSSVNLFYDGALATVETCNELINLPGVNSVIAQTTGQLGGTNFASMLITLLCTGIGLGEAFQRTIKEYNDLTSHAAGSDYMLFLGENFIDFKVDDSLLGKAGEGDAGKAADHITEINNRIEAARQTGQLNLSDMGLTELPEALFSLTGLRGLDISRNPLTGLPETLSKLTSLESFRCHGIKLTTLPAFLFQMRTLEHLSMDDCGIEYIPEQIESLNALTELLMNNNQLRALPKEIAKLPLLEHIGFDKNVIVNVPESVLSKKSGSALVNYFQQPPASPAETSVLEIGSGYNTKGWMVENDGKLRAPRNVKAYSFKRRTGCRKLLDASNLIRESQGVQTLLVLDDTEGIWSEQFGTGVARSFNIRQFFSGFLYRVNAVCIGFSDDEGVFADLVTSGAASSIVLKRKETAPSGLLPLISELMLQSQLSYLGALRWLERYFNPVKTPDGSLPGNDILGFDFYFNAQYFEDIRWVTGDAGTKTMSPEETMRLSKFVSKKERAVQTSIAPLIFICYARESGTDELLQSLREMLDADGYRIAVDTLELSANPNAAVQEQMNRSDAFLLLLSEKYFRSESCMNELLNIFDQSDNRTTGRRPMIFPIYINGTPVMDGAERAKLVKFWANERSSLPTGLGRNPPPYGSRPVTTINRIVNNLDRILRRLSEIQSLVLRGQSTDAWIELRAALRRSLSFETRRPSTIAASKSKTKKASPKKSEQPATKQTAKKSAAKKTAAKKASPKKSKSSKASPKKAAPKKTVKKSAPKKAAPKKKTFKQPRKKK